MSGVVLTQPITNNRGEDPVTTQRPEIETDWTKYLKLDRFVRRC